MVSLIEPLFLVVHAAAAIVTVVTGIASYERSSRAPGLARVCRGLAAGVVVLYVLGIGIGLANTPASAGADRARALGSAIAEAINNGVWAAIVAVPAFFVAWRTLKRA